MATDMYNQTNLTEDNIKMIEMDRKFRIATATQASLSTLGNITVILVYTLMGKKRKKVANYLFACTAFSDLFVSGLAWYMFMISYINSNVPNFPNFENIAYVTYFLQDYSFVVSLGTVLLSTIDRFISVKRPIKHREITMKPKIKLTIFVVWGVSFVPPIIRLCLSKLNYINLYDEKDVIYIYCLHSIILFVILLTYGLLINTFTMVRRIILNPMKGSRRTRDHINVMHKRSRRLVKIFIAMTSAYTVTYLPIIISMILYTSGFLNTMEEYYIVLVTVFADTFYLFSSLINPIITIAFKKDYRVTLMHFACRANKLTRKNSGNSGDSNSNSTTVTNLHAVVDRKNSSVV